MNNNNGDIWYATRIDDTKLKTDAERVKREFRNISDSAEREGSRIGGSLSKGLATIGGSTALFLLGRQILDVTAKFEKFGIVLRNSLGDFRGNEALKMIAQFAATTPFQLDEITAAFIKMTNQGFVPTWAEMTKLGDVASSTGKSFDLLVEAILDAQTGEFERLKEFGIKASSAGDKVTFSFREQKTTVEKTNSAIRGYILSLGELKGIVGANALISQSLTGQISNLGDKLDAMYNKIGSSSKGVIYSAVEGAGILIDNYEEIGKVLIALVATYGAYRAALLSIAAAQQISMVSTMAKEWYTMGKALGFATANQILFNSAAKANVYVMLVTGIVAVASAFWAFSNKADAAAESLQRVNEQVSDERAKVAVLVAQIRDENLSRDERNKRLRELIDLSPTHLKALTLESISTKEGTAAIDGYIEALRKKIQLQEIEKQMGESIKREEEAKNNENRLSLADQLILRVATWSKKGEYERVTTAINRKANAEILAEEKKVQDDLKKQIGNITESGNTGNKETILTFSDQVKAAADNVAKLKTELSDLKKGKGEEKDFAKAIDEKTKSLKEAEERYKLLLGIDTQAAKDALKDREKADEDLKDQRREYNLNAEREYNGKLLALEADTVDKRRALAEQDFLDTIAEIDEKKRKTLELLSAKQGKKVTELTGEDLAQDQDARFRAQEIWAAKSVQITDDAAETIKQIWEDATKGQTSPYNQAIKDVNKQYDELIKKTKAAGASVKELAAIEANRDNALKSIDVSEALKLLEFEQEMMSNLAEGGQTFFDKQKETNRKLLQIKIEGAKERIAIYQMEQEVTGADNSDKIKKETQFLSVAEPALKKLKDNYFEIAGILGDALSQSSDAFVQKMGDTLSSVSSTIGTFQQSDATTMDKVTSIVGLAIKVGNYLKEIRLSEENKALNVQKKVVDEISKRVELETEINKLQSERNETLTESIFLGKNYGAIMSNSMADILKYNGQLNNTITDLFGNSVFSAEGSAKRRLFGTKTGTYEFTIADLIKSVKPEDATTSMHDWLMSALEGGWTSAIQSAVKGDWLKAAGTVLDPVGLFGGYADNKAKIDAFNNLGDAVDKTLKAMGKTVSDFSTMSTQDMLDFFSIMEKTGHITDEGTKKLLASAQEQLELVKKAQEQLKDAISELAGSIGTDIQDILEENFRNGFGYGEDAAKKTAKKISAILENMISSMIYQQAFGSLFDDLKKGMEDSFGANGDKSWIDEFANFMDKMPEAAGLFNQGLAEYQKMAKEKGIDLYLPDTSRAASVKGIATASQESVDENNGRLTAIQGHTYSISENMKILISDCAQILKYLAGIKNDTARLESIERDMSSVKSTLSNIESRGIKIKM
ncbi:MAG: hypothetical protein WC833_08645 [Bacteroidales bacterium]|jgi:hypothetical protein